MNYLTDDQLTTQLARKLALDPAVSTTWTLEIIDGPEQGKRFSLADVVTKRVLIGQSPVCDVTIADRSISRRHAAVESDTVGPRVIDLGSRNGVWLGDTRVRDAYLRPGQIVRFGDTRTRFDTDGAVRTIPTSTDACFGRLIGVSPEMRALYPLFERIAGADVPVLIEGETGTGKEVLAESLHDHSARREAPFVVLDCTTVSPSLIEAELFGHERGAFTGAIATRIGLFEQANGGTLFVDEIGDLEIGLQAKLLRALEKKEIRRVGGTQWIKLDVRIIAATRRDLEREVAARRFRDDLYYRLAVARADLPPLRRRRGDIAFMTRFFWQRSGGSDANLSPDIIQRFESYEWPGNLRELANAVARQLAVGDFEPAMPSGHQSTPTGDYIDAVVKSAKPMTSARHEIIDEFERRYTSFMLAQHGGNVTRAAAASGIGRRYFQMVRAKRP